MNIWLESSASSSARAASSCAPKSSFRGGNVIVGMPAPRAERCDGSIVRLMLILGTPETPRMPPPSRSLGTTGAAARGLQGGRAAGRVVDARRVVRWRLAVDLASRRAGVLTTRELLLEGRRRRRASAQLLAPVEVTPKKSERVEPCTARSVPRSVPSPVPAPDMKSSRVRGVWPRWSSALAAPPAILDARGLPFIAKPLRPG
jgi:hypothetical protein